MTGKKTQISHYHETLSEALQGVELEFSGLEIDFKADIGKTEYCKVEMDGEKLAAFVYAVKNYYWYQMYIDDLPIWGIVGEVSNADAEGNPDTNQDNEPVAYYLYTHKKFDLGYNGNQIVDVNLTNEAKVRLDKDLKEIVFTYVQPFSDFYTTP